MFKIRTRVSLIRVICLGVLVYCGFIFQDNSTLKAQESYDIFNYFPLDVGDTWQYDGKRTILTKDGLTRHAINTRIASIKGSETLNGENVVILEENIDKGPWFYISKSPEGIVLHKMKFQDRYLNHYYLIDTPTVMFYPNNLRLGKKVIYNSQVKRYDLGGNLLDEGFIEIKVKLEKISDVSTAAGTFQNCIKIYRSLLVKTEKITLRVTEENWFAPDIGKVGGKHWIKLKEGKSKQELSFGVDFELKSATIKGKEIKMIRQGR